MESRSILSGWRGILAIAVSAQLLFAALLVAGCTKAAPPPAAGEQTEASSTPPRPKPAPVVSPAPHDPAVASPAHPHAASHPLPSHPLPSQLPSPIPGGPASPVTDDDLLAQSLAKLKQGNLVYNTPQKMKSSQTARITARIGSDQVSVGDLQFSLPATAGTTTATVATPITPRMKMSLKSSDFDITALSSEEQIVSGTIPTSWEWDVVPKHAGALSLHLAATVELNNLSRDFAAIDREIDVKVDPVDATEKFVGKNLVWILGGCGTGLAALWGWWKKRKAKPSSP